jgi:hypothetical protein
VENHNTQSSSATRRGLLSRGLALAVSAPALAAALRVGTAFADDGDNDKDDKKPNRPNPPRRANSFSSDLSTVAQSAAAGDFTSSNPGTDPLMDGRLRLRHRGTGADEGRAQVELRGAAANVSYDVFFWPAASSKPREALGTVGPTNDEGNLNAMTPSDLSGTNRVGVFVIVRHDGNEAGKDEFVTSMGS